MKFLYYFLAWITACQTVLYASDTKILGDEKSKDTWIYLCGLKEDFESESTQDEIAVLHDIGNDLGIKIIAIKPPKTCACFNSKLCWPHGNESELHETYEYIDAILKNEHVSGYLGFSNGGFFLLALVQKVSLGSPVITIGAGGGITDSKAKNQITLLIGKYDFYHYNCAKQFHEQSKHTPLTVELIEYEGGHTIPKKLLYEAIKKTLTSID